MKGFKSFLYVSLTQVANYLFPIITIPIVARTFGPNDLGLLNYITSIVTYFVLMVNFSFNFTGVRRVSRDRDSLSNVFSIIFSIQCVLFSLALLFFLLTIFVFRSFNDNIYLSLVCFSSCLTALFSQNWIFQALHDFKVVAVLSLLSRLLSSLLIVIFIGKGSSLIDYVYIVNAFPLLASVYTFLLSIKRYRINFKIPSLTSCFSYVKEDAYLFFSSVITNLYTTTGVVILGAFTTNYQVGIYTAAQKIIDLVKNVVMMPLNQVLFPILSKKFGEGDDVGIHAVKKLMPLFVIISFVMTLALLLFAKLIILVLFGHEFSDSVTVLYILSVGLFSVFYGIVVGGQVMLNLKMDKAFFNIQLYVSMFSLGVNTIFSSYGGWIVISIVWSMSEFIISTYQIVYLYKRGVRIFEAKMLSISNLKKSFNYVLGR